jgi:hypothetical protein
VQLLLGKVYRKLGMECEAMHHYNEAVYLDPNKQDHVKVNTGPDRLSSRRCRLIPLVPAPPTDCAGLCYAIMSLCSHRPSKTVWGAPWVALGSAIPMATRRRMRSSEEWANEWTPTAHMMIFLITCSAHSGSQLRLASSDHRR